VGVVFRLFTSAREYVRRSRRLLILSLVLVFEVEEYDKVKD
jgi:hypothetical protein